MQLLEFARFVLNIKSFAFRISSAKMCRVVAAIKECNLSEINQKIA